MKNNIIQAVDEFLARVKDEYIADLSVLVSIRSVSEKENSEFVFGKECAKVLDKALDIGKNYGFIPENCEYYCGTLLHPGKTNKEIGIVSHLDIVPEGGGWTYPPFELTVENGMLIGRGTEDDKGPLVAALYAMRFIKENSIELPFAVKLIMGCSEETGMDDLRHFSETRKIPDFSFTPDAEFPVCIGEKGIGTVTLSIPVENSIIEFKGGTVKNAVAGSAYAVIKTAKKPSEFPKHRFITVTDNNGNVRITATGKTAHAATPETGENAIGILAAYLLENSILPESNDVLGFIARSATEYKGETLGIACDDKESGYLTCAASIVKIMDGILYLTFNIRLPVTCKWEQTINAIEKLPYASSWSGRSEPYYISPENPEIKCLTESCEEVLNCSAKPYTMGGGTYARSLKNTVAFGAGIQEYRGLLGVNRGGAHERDEYFSIYEFESSVKIFVSALIKLAAAEHDLA